ncbi:hypothetical protein BU26DRAFT_507603 [Trematosphaeria pertusa]|uniref:J domain-containing protein n=1 Tax=Trematosphaeria pertusa TaxID=390896 RepID=A0A6A6I6I0_9PLEO|nr:uncharacterized protein BU26DRAFT_507603 [Trematosphaeria pertusa]KAF2245937.1 hypothetical protein BU26DRAFT_507603 [Trematosphaeria pertusa]
MAEQLGDLLYAGGCPDPYVIHHPVNFLRLRRASPMDLYSWGCRIEAQLKSAHLRPFPAPFRERETLYRMEVTLRRIISVLEGIDRPLFQQMHLVVNRMPVFNWGVPALDFATIEDGYGGGDSLVLGYPGLPGHRGRRNPDPEFDSDDERKKGKGKFIKYNEEDYGESKKSKAGFKTYDADAYGDPIKGEGYVEYESRGDKYGKKRGSSSKHERRHGSSRSPSPRRKSSGRRGGSPPRSGSPHRRSTRSPGRDYKGKGKARHTPSPSPTRIPEKQESRAKDRGKDSHSTTFAPTSKYSKGKASRATTPPAPPPSSTKFNPYEALGVPRDANEGKLKATRDFLLRKYHPDKQAGQSQEQKDLAATRTADINRAWDIIGDPKRRAIYDKYGYTEAYEIDEKLKGQEQKEWAIVKPKRDGETEDRRDKGKEKEKSGEDGKDGGKSRWRKWKK